MSSQLTWFGFIGNIFFSLSCNFRATLEDSVEEKGGKKGGGPKKLFKWNEEIRLDVMT